MIFIYPAGELLDHTSRMETNGVGEELDEDFILISKGDFLCTCKHFLKIYEFVRLIKQVMT